MRNETVPVPADSDNHLFALTVFHQLHCLVSLFGYRILGHTD